MAFMPHVRFVSRLKLPAIRLKNHFQILTAASTNTARCGDLLYLL
jgi:hypothetical protein